MQASTSMRVIRTEEIVSMKNKTTLGQWDWDCCSDHKESRESTLHYTWICGWLGWRRSLKHLHKTQKEKNMD